MFQTKVKVACIPYFKFDDGLKMLFMKPSDPSFSGTSFQCCKGTIGPGYSSESIALKEAEEELGLTEDNIKDLRFLFYDHINYPDGRSCLIYVYVVEVLDPDKLVPFHYGTGSISWMSIKEVANNLRFIQRNIVYKVYNRIC